ncbi:MAG TPA: response regulator transcription factor [Bryobacteraceae bacterium]|jgi:DNA-binding response OmpR family regulator|nr:response regulator transcription factor [Bryobacteraceae bacterium]
MKTGRILVASSGVQLRDELRTALEFEGHFVSEVDTANQAIQETSSGMHDVLILDSALDGVEPYELCRAIRPTSDLGIILLSRDNSGQGRIDALNAGADDYVPDQFVLAELLARVRAILRRVTRSLGTRRLVVLQDRAIDFQSHEIKGPDGRIAHLTPKECLVLEHLVTHANRPLTPQRLAQTVWQRDGSGQIEYVRVVVKQLRRKLEPDPNKPRYILTQRSMGYQFQMPA